MFRRMVVLVIAVLFLVGCHSKTKEELLGKGLKLINENNPNGAIVLLKKALEKDQNYFEARFHLARAYVLTGKYDQAEKEYLKVSRQNPSRCEVEVELGGLYLLRGKPDEALEAAGRCLRSQPENPTALEITGTGYAQKGNMAEAESNIKKALSIDPNNISAKRALAGVSMAKGDKQGARVLLDEAIQKNKNKKDTRAYYMLASLEMASGNREGAIKVYKTIGETDPKDSNALNKAAMLYLDSGKLAEAEKIADDLLQRFPKRPEGHGLKGIVYYYKKQYDSAITELQGSINLQPQMVSHHFLGLSYYSKGSVEQALSQFQKAVDLNPSFLQARLMVAMILLKQKRFDESIAECRRILNLDEKNALVHNILGSAFMAKRMYDDAMKEFDRAIEIDPKLVDSHVKKGLFSLAKGKAKEGETELDTAVHVAPEILNTRLLLASYHMRMKDYDKAIKTLSEGIRGIKTDALLYNTIAGALIAKKRPDEALTYLQKAKMADPDYFLPYFNSASYYISKDQYEKAMDEYRAILHKDTKNLNALTRMASLLETRGKDEEAFFYYKKAAETKRSEGFLALAAYHLKKKETSKALSVLDEALKTDARNTAAMELKGRIYLSEKKQQDAIKTFEDLERINADKGFSLIVNTYLSARDYQKALTKVEGKAKAAPQRLDLMAEMTRIYVLMGQTQKATETAEKIIRQKPDSAFGYIVLASVFESKKELDRAIDTLKMGIQAEGNNIQARMGLAELYLKKKEYNLAISTCDDIIKKNHDYIPAIFAQGTVYELTGKKKEAAQRYRQVLERSENNVAALNNLSILYADGFGSKDEALKLARKASSLAPSNGSIIDTLGYALLMNGKVDDAINNLEKAGSLLPDNPSIRYHLALAYRQGGKPEKAREQIGIALAKNDFPESAKAKKLLEEMKKK